METNTKSTAPNYRLVVFVFGGGNQLVPLMHLGFCGIPPLGLAHDGLVISFVFWGLFFSVQGLWRWPSDLECEICFGVFVPTKDSLFEYWSLPYFWFKDLLVALWCRSVVMRSVTLSLSSFLLWAICNVSPSNKLMLVVFQPIYGVFHCLMLGFFVGSKFSLRFVLRILGF